MTHNIILFVQYGLCLLDIKHYTGEAADGFVRCEYCGKYVSERD